MHTLTHSHKLHCFECVYAMRRVTHTHVYVSIVHWLGVCARELAFSWAPEHTCI